MGNAFGQQGLGGLIGDIGYTLAGAQNAVNYYQYVQTTGNTNIVWNEGQPDLARHTQEAAKNPEVAWLTRRVKEVSWYGDTE